MEVSYTLEVDKIGFQLWGVRQREFDEQRAILGNKEPPEKVKNKTRWREKGKKRKRSTIENHKKHLASLQSEICSASLSHWYIRAWSFL
jgi:hypothetical protein